MLIDRANRRSEDIVQPKIATLALCSDVYMEAPLHVAASSVLSSLHPDWSAKFYLLDNGIGPAGLRRLRETLDRCRRPYELIEISDADLTIFKRLRPFHGTYTTYSRFLLPDYVTEKRFLYIDTDTVTAADVSPLFQLDMGGHALGVVVAGEVRFALESEFYMAQGAKPDDPAFNAGVMLFDVEQWQSQNCFSRTMDFCNAHPDKLTAADQTALNVLFAKDCYRLSPEFNVQLSTVIREPIPDHGIFHFVGSPKPWDLLGEFFHPYHYIWRQATKGIALNFAQASAYTDPRSWVRFTRILGGYRRILRQRYHHARAERQKPQAVPEQHPSRTPEA